MSLSFWFKLFSFTGNLRGNSLQMEINSIEKLCNFLISCAFRRCRMLDDVCKLSVSLTPAPSLVRISVSDTGIGSTLEEFQKFKYSNHPFLVNKWDGVLCIVTTSISDEELHLLKFDWKVSDASKRLERLPSVTKNGAKYSGTEVSLSLFEETDSLVTMITEFVRKMILMRTSKIAVEFSVVSGGNLESQSKSIILQSACISMPVDAANIGYLKSAFEDYVSKHGNRLLESCQSCFSTGKSPKVGTGIACSRNHKRSGEQVMEVVIIISETSNFIGESSCTGLCGRKTEVLYFRDFSPWPISESCREALSNFDWKKYGLVLKSVEDNDGATFLEWENLPPETHIDIVLHRYRQQAMMLPLIHSTTKDKSLTTRAVKLALNDLKKCAGVLLSQHAAKICSYAPDLAKSISGLILSSPDKKFQSECFSLLGLQLEDNAGDVLEKCINDKITYVVSRDDGNPRGTIVAPLLFADKDYHEAHGPTEQYYCHDEDEVGPDAFD